MQSEAKTVAGYLTSLPADRQKVMVALRKAIKQNIPAGFEEVMSYGMIGYVVPHKVYPAGYHVTPEQPLPFICIASQKNHIAFYHMALYEGPLSEWFKEEWKAHSKKKLDMGKSCVRFKKPEDVPVDLLGQVSSKMTPTQWIEQYEKGLSKLKKKKA